MDKINEEQVLHITGNNITQSTMVFIVIVILAAVIIAAICLSLGRDQVKDPWIHRKGKGGTDHARDEAEEFFS